MLTANMMAGTGDDLVHVCGISWLTLTPQDRRAMVTLSRQAASQDDSSSAQSAIRSLACAKTTPLHIWW